MKTPSHPLTKHIFSPIFYLNSLNTPAVYGNGKQFLVNEGTPFTVKLTWDRVNLPTDRLWEGVLCFEPVWAATETKPISYPFNLPQDPTGKEAFLLPVKGTVLPPAIYRVTLHLFSEECEASSVFEDLGFIQVCKLNEKRFGIA